MATNMGAARLKAGRSELKHIMKDLYERVHEALATKTQKKPYSLAHLHTHVVQGILIEPQKTNQMKVTLAVDLPMKPIRRLSSTFCWSGNSISQPIRTANAPRNVKSREKLRPQLRCTSICNGCQQIAFFQLICSMHRSITDLFICSSLELRTEYVHSHILLFRPKNVWPMQLRK